MSFLVNLVDVVLTLILLFDTLGMIYQFRKHESAVKPKEFVRICFSWILFLTICSLFSCDGKGFFCTLIRLIIIGAKVYVTIPLLGGAMKIHKYLIEDGKAIEYYNKVHEIVKSKLCKGAKTLSQSSFPSGSFTSATTEPEQPKSPLMEDNQQGDTMPEERTFNE